MALLERVSTLIRANLNDLIEKAEDPETLRREKVDEFRQKFANPYVAAERGYIDAVIEPRDTRPKLIAALRMLETKRDTNPPKKHGNIPL